MVEEQGCCKIVVVAALVGGQESHSGRLLGWNPEMASTTAQMALQTAKSLFVSALTPMSDMLTLYLLCIRHQQGEIHPHSLINWDIKETQNLRSMQIHRLRRIYD